MIVTHFQRRPIPPQNFSMERVFSAVRGALPPWVDCRLVVSRYQSRGLLARLYNIFEAMRKQQGINHVTGDISYLTVLLRKQNTLLTIHDCGSMHRLSGWRRAFFRLCWLWLPVRRAAVVSVISEQTKQELMRFTGCPAHKIRVIPDPVAPEFRPSPRPFRQQMPHILQVGTGANKNVSRVAEALRDLTCELHIVGHLHEEDRRQLERCSVRYRESRDLTDEQMVAAYWDSDLVVFASTYEGFGLPIIEANAAGRVVITSDLGPMADVAGGAAALADPYDPASIRAAIRRVIEDAAYREDLIEKGFHNAARFAAGQIAAQYAALYSEMRQKVCSPVPEDERCAV
jgi:glycosyltransferase involved in cell wall biosynthesis